MNSYDKKMLSVTVFIKRCASQDAKAHHLNGCRCVEHFPNIIAEKNIGRSFVSRDNDFVTDVVDADDAESSLNLASEPGDVDVSVGQLVASDLLLLKENGDAEKVFGEQAPGLNSRWWQLLRSHNCQTSTKSRREDPKHFGVLEIDTKSLEKKQ